MSRVYKREFKAISRRVRKDCREILGALQVNKSVMVDAKRAAELMAVAKHDGIPARYEQTDLYGRTFKVFLVKPEGPMPEWLPYEPADTAPQWKPYKAPDPLPEFLSASQFASIVGYSIQHIAELCREGRIEGAFFSDGKWQIPLLAKLPCTPKPIA